VKIEGLKEVNAKLRKMERRVAKQVTRKALREGGKIIQAAAKAAAPVKSGLLKRSIKVRAGRSRMGKVDIVVGLGKKWWAGMSWYGSLQEFGFKRGSRKLGDSRKQVEGKHFLENAYNSTKSAALARVIEALKQGVEEAGK
jgi:HK97 gp10 family phage protein